MPGKFDNEAERDSLRDRLDIDFALNSAGLGIWELNPITMQVLWDDRCRELFGLATDNFLPYEQAIAFIHTEDVARVDAAVQKAFEPESGGLYDVTYRTMGADDGKLRWVRFYGKSYFDETGRVYRFGGVAQDVTQDVQAQQRQQATQRQILDSFEASPVGIALLDQKELTFLRANSFYGELVGRKPDEIVGKPLIEALPEIQGQGFVKLLQGVLETGLPYTAKEASVTLERGSGLETIFIDFTYQPLFELGSSQIIGILVIATDVTQQVQSRKIIEAREAQLRDIIATAPAAMGLFVGRDLIVEMPNQAFIDIVGKGPDIAGKPLREVMPELENQPFLKILDDVYTSGVMFQSDGSQVNIVQNGVMTYNFYNITYTPLLNEKGEVYAILDIAIDVTESIRTQKQLAEAQSNLAQAIDMAELATWQVDFETGNVEYSPRLRQWCGLEGDEVLSIPRGYEAIDPADHAKLKAAMDHCRRFPNDALFDVEYSVSNLKTGQKRVLHAQGKVKLDQEGKVKSMSGTAQDITLQKNTQVALELLVQERTEELEATNEELQASNEQIFQANEQLLRSNESLEEFAYIASHDLQEPLRKIRQFTDRLDLRHRSSLGEDARFLDSIQKSAQRMSLLIDDLLTFSKISSGFPSKQSVSLTSVLAQVVDTLSVSIEETKAEISLESLPIIQGDERQLEQLFQNLLSNALKFSSKDENGNPAQPYITITHQLVEYDPLSSMLSFQPLQAHYHQIIIQDNGIGFDNQYAERIFGVFQRLHGKNEFAGTGVGLAICQKVALNHGGFIIAQSKPGQGATFCVYLPN
ncbi:PAS domain S-box protein [Siphonobacter sp. SORGH_AS_0500]|uniref:PAS domain-containing sensor histidine kinase n=1 Tax=Siphonobacter sp. SORGH_AS_0500 TaxID=1864824 RepID=UPI00286288AE|nr:PAS domain S-box protein [Siphonobacter sp. SORGH_AS_0500]MDR6193328.1 PAS domain S-box-containing protein [Siphonobacter sp. SORGH_AS_0500]